LIEYFLDFNNIYALYSVYTGIILGLSLKLFFDWAIKDANINILTNKIDFTLTINDLQLQKKSLTTQKDTIVWLIRFIRNKTGTGDEKEQEMILLQS
jgi:hypothetical protein